MINRTSPHRALIDDMAARGSSGGALAAAIGVSRTTVSNWRTGRHPPRASHAVALAKYFGVPVERYIGGDEAPSVGSAPVAGGPEDADLVLERLAHLELRSLARNLSDVLSEVEALQHEARTQLRERAA